MIKKTYKIALPSISICQGFVRMSSSYSDASFKIISGRYEIDAKSLMSIFALDISRPMQLVVEMPVEILDTVTKAVAPYVVKEVFA